MKAELSPACRKYIKRVSRRLDMPKKQKLRICSDLTTTIQAQLEDGIPEEKVLKKLGAPKKVAAEFNEQMGDPTARRSPQRFVCLAAAIVSVVVLLGKLALNLWINSFSDVHSIGIIGGADGPTSVFVSTTISDGFSSDTTFWIGILILGLLGYFWFRRKKKKENDK